MSLEDERRTLVSGACVQWQAEIRIFLAGVLKCRDQVDDAWQRTVVSAMKAAGNVEPATVRGWLFQVALNEARQLRRVSRRQAEFTQKLAADVRVPWYREKVDQQAGEDKLATDELVALVRKSMERLPEEQRTVVRMRIYDGKSFAVIAEELGRPIGTVLTWMRRAILNMKQDRHLRSLVEAEEE